MLPSLNGQFFLSTLNTVTYLPDVNQRITIDNEAQLIVGTDVEDERLVLSGLEDTVQTCREVLEIHARGKHRIAAIAQFDGIGNMDGSHRLSLHLGIVPIDGLHALVTQWTLNQIVATLEGFVTSQSATLDVFDV